MAFASYLNSRKQYVSADDNCMSKLQCIKTGVRQGKVGLLGPLLFLIYINDLPISTSSKTILYADDVALIYHTKNFSQLLTMAKNGMVRVVKWASCNKLLMNFKKKNCLLLASSVLLINDS